MFFFMFPSRRMAKYFLFAETVQFVSNVNQDGFEIFNRGKRKSSLPVHGTIENFSMLICV